jgi:hypothetical protein
MSTEKCFPMYVSYTNVIKPLEDDPESAESKSIMDLIEQRVVKEYGELSVYFEVDYPTDQEDAVSFCEIYDDCYTDIQVIKIFVTCLPSNS